MIIELQYFYVWVSCPFKRMVPNQFPCHRRSVFFSSSTLKSSIRLPTPKLHLCLAYVVGCRLFICCLNLSKTISLYYWCTFAELQHLLFCSAALHLHYDQELSKSSSIACYFCGTQQSVKYSFTTVTEGFVTQCSLRKGLKENSITWPYTSKETAVSNPLP